MINPLNSQFSYIPRYLTPNTNTMAKSLYYDMALINSKYDSYLTGGYTGGYLDQFINLYGGGGYNSGAYSPLLNYGAFNGYTPTYGYGTYGMTTPFGMATSPYSGGMYSNSSGFGFGQLTSPPTREQQEFMKKQQELDKKLADLKTKNTIQTKYDNAFEDEVSEISAYNEHFDECARLKDELAKKQKAKEKAEKYKEKNATKISEIEAEISDLESQIRQAEREMRQAKRNLKQKEAATKLVLEEAKIYGVKIERSTHDVRMKTYIPSPIKNDTDDDGEDNKSGGPKADGNGDNTPPPGPPPKAETASGNTGSQNIPVGELDFAKIMNANTNNITQDSMKQSTWESKLKELGLQMVTSECRGQRDDDSYEPDISATIRHNIELLKKEIKNKENPEEVVKTIKDADNKDVEIKVSVVNEKISELNNLLDSRKKAIEKVFGNIVTETNVKNRGADIALLRYIKRNMSKQEALEYLSQTNENGHFKNLNSFVEQIETSGADAGNVELCYWLSSDLSYDEIVKGTKPDISKDDKFLNCELIWSENEIKRNLKLAIKAAKDNGFNPPKTPSGGNGSANGSVNGSAAAQSTDTANPGKVDITKSRFMTTGSSGAF